MFSDVEVDKLYSDKDSFTIDKIIHPLATAICSPKDFLADPFLYAATVVRSRTVKLTASTGCCPKYGDVPKSPLQRKMAA